MSTEPSDNSSEKSSTTAISGGVNVDAQHDVNIGGDVVGRDKTTTNIDTGGGAYVTGDVNVASGGEFVGRDKLVNVYEAPVPVVTALHQLPSPPRDFTGRGTESAQLASALAEGTHTGLVLHGLGGVGKSALALALAEQLTASYPDAQFYINLQGTKQPLSTAEAMTLVLRAYYPTSKLPDNEANLSGQYQSTLYNKRAVLVLDDAASAEQIERLIPPASCVMIVTSRQHFTLPGLFTHGLDTLPPEDAQALLIRIAPRIDGHAHTLSQLCGYLPLALRVAASTLATHVNLDPGDYIRKLADTRERLELVEASLSLSYELLTPHLKHTWCLLSIFPDIFDEKVARAVLEMKPGRVLDELSELVRGNLVEWNEVAQSYRLHDLVRLFAEKRLSKHERQGAHQRAGRYYNRDKRQRYLLETIFHFQRGGLFEQAAELATANTSVIMGRGQARMLRSLLEQFQVRQLSEPQVIAVSISLGQVYALMGEGSRARTRFRQAIAQATTLSRSSSKPLLLARAYRGMGDLLQRESPQAALKWLQRGLQKLAGRDALLEADMRIKAGTIFMDLQKYATAQNSVERGMKLLPRGSGQLRAAALLNLSEIYYRQGDLGQGQRFARRALKISAQLRDDWMMLRLRINMGVNADIGGKWSETLTIYQEAAELAAQLGDVNHLTMLRINLGLLHMNMGDYIAAKDHLQKGLDSARNHDLKEHLVNLLCNIADLNLRQGNGQDAMLFLLEAERLAKELGLDGPLPEIYRSLAQARLLQKELRQASTLAQKSVKLATKLDDKVEMGKSWRVLGQVQWANNQHKAALASFERGASLLEDLDPYEAARTQLEWGRVLLATDRDQSVSLLHEARAVFGRLGAQRDVTASSLV
jgi:tetratricopeptide (TPR) repeat protein